MRSLTWQVRACSGANALLAAWLVVSILALGENPVRSLWPVLLVAALIGILATVRTLWPGEGAALSWANGLLGLWVAISPWSINYLDNEVLLVNSAAVGTAVVILAAWSSATTTMISAASRSREQSW